jgi:hypothetical protein
MFFCAHKLNSPPGISAPGTAFFCFSNLHQSKVEKNFVKNAPASVIDSERQKLAMQKDIVEKSRGEMG